MLLDSNGVLTRTANLCTCPNGSPQTGPGCTENGAVMCKSCDVGWNLNAHETACDGLYTKIRITPILSNLSVPEGMVWCGTIKLCYFKRTDIFLLPTILHSAYVFFFFFFFLKRARSLPVYPPKCWPKMRRARATKTASLHLPNAIPQRACLTQKCPIPIRSTPGQSLIKSTATASMLRNRALRGSAALSASGPRVGYSTIVGATPGSVTSKAEQDGTQHGSISLQNPSG